MLRAAVVQMTSTLMDPADNLARIETWLAHAADEGARLVVFPECIVTGYFLSGPEAESIAEPIPGLRTERLVRACARHGLSAAQGLIERGPNGGCYNAAVLASPEGILVVYRKTHLLCLGVDRYLTRGERLPPIVSAADARIGLLICYDLRFPEPMRVLALDGAQVILLPTAWPATAGFYPDFLARARAAENGVYLLNRVGQERGQAFLGRSPIVGPDGEVVAEARPGRDDVDHRFDLARSDRKHCVFGPAVRWKFRVGAELYGRLMESWARHPDPAPRQVFVPVPADTIIGTTRDVRMKPEDVAGFREGRIGTGASSDRETTASNWTGGAVVAGCTSADRLQRLAGAPRAGFLMCPPTDGARSLAWQTTVTAFDHIDVLANIAGWGHYDWFEDLSADDLRRHTM
jgi:predicted amidohydrolase